MEQNLPRGGDIVIQRPFGGGVGVGVVLILQYLVVVEHLQGSPLGIEEVGEVADILNEKRIVILNLETCPNDVSQRIIDFLYGVAYANHGDFKKVAGRAYIITPYNVPVTGELLDELGGMGGDQY